MLQGGNLSIKYHSFDLIKQYLGDINVSTDATVNLKDKMSNVKFHNHLIFYTILHNFNILLINFYGTSYFGTGKKKLPKVPNKAFYFALLW